VQRFETSQLRALLLQTIALGSHLVPIQADGDESVEHASQVAERTTISATSSSYATRSSASLFGAVVTDRSDPAAEHAGPARA